MSKKLLFAEAALAVILTILLLGIFVAVPTAKKVNYANAIIKNAGIFDTLTSTEVDHISMGSPSEQFGIDIYDKDKIDTIMTTLNSYSYAPTGETGNYRTLWMRIYTVAGNYDIAFFNNTVELNNVVYNYKSEKSLFDIYRDIYHAQYRIEYPND